MRSVDTTPRRENPRAATPTVLDGDTTADRPVPLATQVPVVDVVIPVYNEQLVLRQSIERLHAFLLDSFPFSWRITIVDNASTDRTWSQACELAARLDHVEALHLDRKGRGLALRTAWSNSDATVVAYMDVDLSTGLDALLPLVAPLVSGHSDVAIGSRLAPGAHVARGPRREFISRTYNALLRTFFAAKVRDAQCGFKAVRTDVARRLLPEVEDDGWFFDTELLLLADHNGMRIHEVPVDWIDDPDSRVDVVHTALGDLAGTARMMMRFLRGGGEVRLERADHREPDDDFGRRLVTFGMIGAASTIVSLVLFLLLWPSIGAVAANLVALSATFAANTWANARFTARRRRVHWARAISLFAGAVGLSTVALAIVDRLDVSAALQLATLLATWLLASLARLVMVDGWSRRTDETDDAGACRPTVTGAS
jgi:glycosyltransferase involved in cell wall biosynthesis